MSGTANEYAPHNILLTGGCGFIGSHVIRFLVRSFLSIFTGAGYVTWLFYRLKSILTTTL